MRFQVARPAFNWKIVAENDSMYNTPPTYAIYIAGLVFEWLKRQGGIAVIEERNRSKAAMLYEYAGSVGNVCKTGCDPRYRSRMNVPFFLADEALNEVFLARCQRARLLQLKGHKSVGGMRASLYNAMPVAGVEALIDYLREFERVRG